MWLQATALAGPPLASVAFAAADPTTGFDFQSLIGTLITPVIVVLLFLTGKIRTESEVKRLEADGAAKDRQIAVKDEQLQTMQAGLVERAIPALTRTTLVLETLSPILQQDARSGIMAHRRREDEQ